MASLKSKPIFGNLDGLDLRTDQFDAVLVQNTLLGKCDCKIQGGLTAHGRKQRVWAFVGNDGFQVLDVRGSR